MAATERAFTEADVKAWRRDGWILVSLAGEIVLRRFTRDKAFTHVAVVFREGWSPPPPQTRENFTRAEVLPPATRGRHPGSNGYRLIVPISTTPQPRKEHP